MAPHAIVRWEPQPSLDLGAHPVILQAPALTLPSSQLSAVQAPLHPVPDALLGTLGCLEVLIPVTGNTISTKAEIFVCFVHYCELRT